MDKRNHLCLKRALATSQKERDHITQQINAMDRGELLPPIKDTYERIGKYERINKPWTKNQVRGWKILGAAIVGAWITYSFWPQETPWRNEYTKQRLEVTKKSSKPIVPEGCYQAHQLKRVLTKKQMALFVQAAIKSGFYELDSMTYCFKDGQLSITPHGKAINP